MTEVQETKKILKKEFLKTVGKIIICVLLAASLLLNLFTYIIPVVKYYGTSMSPTLEDGQILLVSKLSEVNPGDVIAFYYNNNVLVRRVIAKENEQVTIDIFGTVSVNGKELSEEYAKDKTLGQCNISFPYQISTDSYFVLGDNRDVSMDSRLEEVGCVTEDRIIGKLIFSVKPFGLIK